MPELAQLRILMLSVAAAVLAACAAGPDYARPDCRRGGSRVMREPAPSRPPRPSRRPRRRTRSSGQPSMIRR